jgi:hypothetical protein
LSYAKRNTPILSFEKISLITTTTDIKQVREMVKINWKGNKGDTPIQTSLFEG